MILFCVSENLKSTGIPPHRQSSLSTYFNPYREKNVYLKMNPENSDYINQNSDYHNQKNQPENSYLSIFNQNSN